MKRLVQGWCLIGRHHALVLFVGPVECGGSQAPVYACQDCCDYMRHYVRQYNAEWDARPAS
ncbi:hypothetical protein [Streptomyces scabiei]|uniref:hypothetical protein n=1 Tax=Streptomyces scabiei TaxID=1930 RepID=UPI0029AA5E90|nr:hypothetical protein [Streptomyces scabiei]MDX3206102.1 hypothetical protein [Streptomyces scabiei]